MQETDGDNTAADPLAELVRAAGRRGMPPQKHYDQVYAAVHATWRNKLQARRRRRWYVIAASTALLAVGGMLWQAIPDPTPDAAARIAIARGTVELHVPARDLWTNVSDGIAELPAGARIRTGDDGAVSLRLTDGGSLRLAENTELAFSGNAFEMASGRLYFDSSGRRDDSTIDVDTPLGTVRDIGTQFEVLASTDDLRIRVRSGSVMLFESAASIPITGDTGEEIRLSAAGQLSRREIAADSPEWAWAESLAVAPDFDNPTVLRYLIWIAEETGKSLEFASENVRLQAELARFAGDPGGLLPTELLVTIAATSDFDCEVTDHGTILIRRDTLQE